MDESLTSEDNAIVQVETLETLIVWFNKSFQEDLSNNNNNDANTTLNHINLADGYLLYQAGNLLSPEHFPQDDTTNKLIQTKNMYRFQNQRCWWRPSVEINGVRMEALLSVSRSTLPS